MPSMWADTLLAGERAYLLRLIAWAAASVLAGTGLLAWHLIRRRGTPLLQHFAVQTAAWGAAELAYGVVVVGSLALRDVAGAARLDRALWLAIGLDIGCVFAGACLVGAAWWLGGPKRNGVIGAGVGIVVQGAALALLHLPLTTQLVVR